MITISNLTKKYGSKTALDGVSFTVKKGEVLGFLGPNGAGKSTAMNIITGYLSSTEGTVTIDGYDIEKEPINAKRCIGYLPELPPLYLDMTVEEYLGFVYDLKNVREADKKKHIINILETVKIADVSKRKIGNLSKGYRQRVGLAGALVGNPPVLILDEPTVGLDPKQIIEVRNVIKELGKEKTIILSSHILSEISAVCDRVIIINKGKIVAEDTPQNLSAGIEKKSRICLTVEGDREEAEKLLGSIDGITDIACTSSRNDEYDFEFDTTMQGDEKKKVFFAFAEAGMPIVSLSEREVSLEDIFITLTGGAGREENADESNI